jgi:hypothetical protein
VALAFLLASTPSHNSDLWLHLASGRELVQGRSLPGTDPFSSTTAGVLWVNHAWLSDAILYELYEIGGGRALVIAKSVLVTVLAGIFFCFRRRGTRLGILFFAATSAVLALGPWLLLQPALLSLLGVVLTLYLLERPSLVEDSKAERVRSLRWLLVPLFALWANLDAWFLLGPVLVGLYALGELLRFVGMLSGGSQNVPVNHGAAPNGRRSDLRSLVLLALAGLAACLLTPYHYHTFAWPTPLGLSHTEQALMHDPLGRGLVVSPFGMRITSSPAFASPGGWAYCVLLVSGAASFVLCGRGVHPGRLLAWLALAALSIYQARAIPFFAVAAGPILALNLQEWAFTAKVTEPVRRLQAVARGVGVPAGLALLVLAWPGWLQPTPFRPRAWMVEPDDSLVRMARQLERRHAEEEFRPDRVALNFSPEVAAYLAWYCPAEKGFLDSRWCLYDRVADDYVAMRSCLLQPDGAGPDRELGPLLDAHHIDRIILHDPDFARTTQAYRCLLRGGDEWELLDIEGTAVLFGRRCRSESPVPWKALERRREAYHPEPDRRAPLEASRMPQPPGPFDPFLRDRNDRSAERGEAALHLDYFDMVAERGQAGLRTQWLYVLAAGLVGSAPGTESAGALAVRLHLIPLVPNASPDHSRADGPPAGQQAAEQLAAAFLATRDERPPEALLLAVRAARRALAIDPEDAGAFLLLGEAYVRLGSQTREKGWQQTLPELAAFRKFQILTALEQAVFLRPDLDRAHAMLAQLYFQDGQMDRALDHLRARLRIAEQESATGGSEAQAATERLQADVKKMESLVQRSLNIYEVNSADKTDPSRVLDRARLAARHGLTRKALEMLLESHPAIFGKSGAQMQLDLMLRSGRAFEVHSWLEPQHEAELGFSSYHLLQAQAAAACGGYADADAELDALSQELRHVGITPELLVPVRTAIALRVGNAVLARPVPGTGPAGLAATVFSQFNAVRPLRLPADLLRQEANLRVLRGLLALESGAVESAGRHFRAALDVWGSDSQAATGAGVDFPARPIAEQALRLLEEDRR